MRSAPRRIKRPQLFLMLGFLSLVWLGAMIWMMHGMNQQHGKVEESTDFLGGDIDSVYGVESMLSCRTLCEEHPRCLAFTFVKNEQACWLKGAGGYTAKVNPNTTSGLVNATLAEARRRTWNATSRRHAQDEEGELTYDGMHRREADGLDEGDTYRTGGYRADEWQPRHETTAEEMLKYNDSTSFFGDVRVETDVHEPVECEALCVDDGRCVAWTLDKARFLCLRRLLNVSTVRYTDDVIGGRLSAAQIAARAARLLETIRSDEEALATADALPDSTSERPAATAPAQQANGSDARRGARNETGANEKAPAARTSRKARAAAAHEKQRATSNASNARVAASGNASSSNATALRVNTSSATVGRKGTPRLAHEGKRGRRAEHRRQHHSDDDDEEEEEEEEEEEDEEEDKDDDDDDEDEDVDDPSWAERAQAVVPDDFKLDAARRRNSLYVGDAWPLPAELVDASRIFDNVDLMGGDLTYRVSIDTVSACVAACVEEDGSARARGRTACVAWTLEKRTQRCFLKGSGYKRVEREKSAAVISGVLPARLRS